MRDITGKTFNLLTAMRRVEGAGRIAWICRCACGKEKVVSRGHLVTGHTKSCGCFKTASFAGKNNPRWNGGKNVTPLGYVRVLAPEGHPRADGNNRIFEHILVVEAAMGMYLPDGAVVHHIDENRQNNAPQNLQLCASQAEHHEIHVKLRAFKACGHEDWIKCPYCGKYDAPENMYVYAKKPSIHFHRACSNAATIRTVQKKKAAQALI